MLASCPIIAFLATRDASRAMSFYRDILGLSLVGDSPAALVFDANGTMLRIQKVSECSVAPYTALGWSVPDLREKVEELTGRGVKFERFTAMAQDELGVWTSPDGHQVAWFKDPDGHLLSLTEFRA